VIVLIIVLALLAAIGYGAMWQEHRVTSAQAEAKATRAERDAALASANSEKITTQVVTQYVDRVQVVREVGATITKEVPVYVTAKADAACPVPLGFVRLHDAAAEGRVPDPSAGDPDAPAAGLALSAVADTVAGNYSTCHETAAQLTALQDWLETHSPPAEKAQ
jgi:type II secretory pathway pseudopilin PulG